MEVFTIRTRSKVIIVLAASAVVSLLGYVRLKNSFEPYLITAINEKLSCKEETNTL